MRASLRRHSKYIFIKFTKQKSIEKLFSDINNNLMISALNSKTKKLGREILDFLGSNNSRLFYEYERLVCLEESYCIENAYHLGKRERLK